MAGTLCMLNSCKHLHSFVTQFKYTNYCYGQWTQMDDSKLRDLVDVIVIVCGGKG